MKYVYDIVKPSFASAFMRLGRVNASAKKITSGVLALHLGDHPFPERERLGVRIVDAEGLHAVRRSRTAARRGRRSRAPGDRRTRS